MKIEADFTWTGNKFESGVQIEVDDSNGKILNVNVPDKFANQDASNFLKLKGFLLPGFVNAHSHAFQRLLRGKGDRNYEMNQKSSFWTWRKSMYALAEGLDAVRFKAACKTCFQEMLDAGITTVGEFHYFHHDIVNPDSSSSALQANFYFDTLVIEAAIEAGIRIVLLNAFYQWGGCGRKPLSSHQKRFETSDLTRFWEQLEDLQTMCKERGYSRNMVQLGVVAHSIRAVDRPELKELIIGAKERGYAFHMHLEEQVKEIEECRKAFGGKSPLEVLLDLQVSLDHVTLVHCTHSAETEVQKFVAAGGTVCICPLTEGSLADGLPNIPPMAGRVCLGTDCNNRIDFFEEMRWLEYGQRVSTNKRGACCKMEGAAVPWENDLPSLLLKFATRVGADALLLNNQVGEISVGYFADFCLVTPRKYDHLESLPTGDVLTSAIFAGDCKVDNVCINGKWRYPLANVSSTSREPIASPKRVKRRFPSIATSFKIPQTFNSTKRVKPSTRIEFYGVEESTPKSTLKAEKLCVTNDAAIQKVLDAGEDLIKLARAFIDIDSTTGNEALMCKAMNQWLQARGYTISQTFLTNPDAIEDHVQRRCNIKAYKGPKVPRIFFNTHLDVVPPHFPSRVDDTNLYGRGACDTKSLSAAMLIAVEELRREHNIDVGLLFVVSEETDHSGMKAVTNFNPDYLIVGEPTAGKVAAIQKGILKCKVTCKGISAHSGYPHLGRSAIDDMLSFLSDVRRYNDWPAVEGLGKTTCNIGFIKGGQALNALAEYCEASLMFRVVSSPQIIHDILSKLCQKYTDMSIEVLTQNDPVDMSYVKNLISGFEFFSASFNTDIPFLKFDGKAVLYGHGSICDAHCPREFISLNDLKSLVGRYKELALQLHRQLK